MRNMQNTGRLDVFETPTFSNENNSIFENFPVSTRSKNEISNVSEHYQNNSQLNIVFENHPLSTRMDKNVVYDKHNQNTISNRNEIYAQQLNNLQSQNKNLIFENYPSNTRMRDKEEKTSEISNYTTNVNNSQNYQDNRKLYNERINQLQALPNNTSYPINKKMQVPDMMYPENTRKN